jgi:hypothetical protein
MVVLVATALGAGIDAMLGYGPWLRYQVRRYAQHGS